MALDTPTLTVELEELANQPPTVTQEIQVYDLQSDYLTPTDEWSFTVYSPDDPSALRELYVGLQPVRLSISGQVQVIGRIDDTEGEGEGGTALRVRGRDYLADFVTGSVDPTTKFKKSQTIGDAILEVAKPFGITSISGDGNNTTRNLLTGAQPYKGAPKDFKTAKLDEFKAGYNEGAYEVANKMAARHGCTIQPTLDRSKIVLGVPQYDQEPLYRLVRGYDNGPHPGGNIVHGTARRNYGRVPTLVSATGRSRQTTSNPVLPMETIASVLDLLGHVEGNFATAPGPTTSTTTVGSTKSIFGAGALSLIGKVAEVINTVLSPNTNSPRIISKRFTAGQKAIPGNDNKLYRPLFYQDKDSRNVSQLERGVKRQISNRLKDTLTYTCTLRGHVDPDSGALYAVDTIAKVDDYVENVHENLWIKSRRFYNNGEGPMTELTMLRPGSFVL